MYNTPGFIYVVDFTEGGPGSGRYPKGSGKRRGSNSLLSGNRDESQDAIDSVGTASMGKRKSAKKNARKKFAQEAKDLAKYRDTSNEPAPYNWRKQKPTLGKRFYGGSK